MANLKIEIDEAEAYRKMTLREKAGIYILFTIFRMIYPAKYSHQLDKLEGAIFGCLEVKDFSNG